MLLTALIFSRAFPSNPHRDSLKDDKVEFSALKTRNSLTPLRLLSIYVNANPNKLATICSRHVLASQSFLLRLQEIYVIFIKYANFVVKLSATRSIGASKRTAERL